MEMIKKEFKQSRFLKKEGEILYDYNNMKNGLKKNKKEYTYIKQTLQPIRPLTQEEYKQFVNLPIIQNNIGFNFRIPNWNGKAYKKGDFIYDRDVLRLYENQNQFDKVGNTNSVYEIVKITKDIVSCRKMEPFKIVVYDDKTNYNKTIGLILQGVYDNDGIINIPRNRLICKCIIRPKHNYIYMYDDLTETILESQEAYRRFKYGENYIKNYENIVINV